MIYRPLAALDRDVELEEITILDRIYRIFRILSQFPEET